MAETMLDRLALIACRHMDVFMAGGDRVKFPLAPSEAAWSDYSPREQAAGRFLAREFLAALMDPTNPMIFFGMDAMSRDDLEPTEDEFRAGFTAAIRAAAGTTFIGGTTAGPGRTEAE